MPYDEDKQIQDNELIISNNASLIMAIDCVKCGVKEGIGCITFGKHNMCQDCGNKFINWMYEKLVDEWLKEK